MGQLLKPDAPAPRYASWSRIFLAELAATSNVSAAARKAGVSTGTVYEARRSHAGFYRQWQAALCEGYDLLEMELLRRLREGEIKPAASARRGVRVFDYATACRLLMAHRATIVRERAGRAEEDAALVLAEIDARLDRMQQRLLTPPAEAAEAAADGQ
jgi:hypothetical protein